MIEFSIGDICGYLGTIWCIANLVWGLFRNDASRVLIYGIGTFAAIVVMLNVGGILNEKTWGLFGLCVFGLHLAATIWTHEWWKSVVFGILFLASMFSYVGVI